MSFVTPILAEAFGKSTWEEGECRQNAHIG
jgi:hypothetical protein